MVGMHVNDVLAHRDAACSIGHPDWECPVCPVEPDPNVFAYCEIAAGAIEGRCNAVELTTHELSACEFDGDCRLRIGTSCCEGCSDESQIVALNRYESNLLDSMRCDDEPGVGCPDCLPQIPPQYQAVCSDRHCTVLTGE